MFVTIDIKTNSKQSKHRSKSDFVSLIYLVLCIVVNYTEGSMFWIVIRNYPTTTTTTTTTTGLLLTQRVQNIDD